MICMSRKHGVSHMLKRTVIPGSASSYSMLLESQGSLGTGAKQSDEFEVLSKKTGENDSQICSFLYNKYQFGSICVCLPVFMIVTGRNITRLGPEKLVQCLHHSQLRVPGKHINSFQILEGEI